MYCSHAKSFKQIFWTDLSWFMLVKFCLCIVEKNLLEQPSPFLKEIGWSNYPKILHFFNLLNNMLLRWKDPGLSLRDQPRMIQDHPNCKTVFKSDCLYVIMEVIYVSCWGRGKYTKIE